MTTAIASPAIDICASDETALDDVIEMTREFFSGPISTEEMFDPENPAERWTVVDVESKASVTEMVRLQISWHEALAVRCPEMALKVRLSINPLE